MDENDLQKLIKRIFNHIKEKYGYTDEQALIYLQGYQDCASAKKSFTLKTDEVKEYYQITLDDDTIKDIITGRGLKPLNPKK